MRRHRTTALGILGTLLLAAVAAVVATTPARGSVEVAVPRLVFPLVAKTDLWDNYGDPRPNGRHAGIDMENPWHAPVVAVEDGRVQYAQSGPGGCMLYLYGRSGTMYLYIHLNNDLGAKNDNRGGCVSDVAFSVPDGAKVTAGQRSRGSETPATRAEIRTSTSRCTRTEARTSTPSSTCPVPESRSSHAHAPSSASRSGASSSPRARERRPVTSSACGSTRAAAGSTWIAARSSSPLRSARPWRRR